MSIVGLVFGHSAAEQQTVSQAQALIGPAAGKAMAAFLQASKNTTHGAIATALGLITLLFSASGVVIELRDALNLIWDVPMPSLSGFQMVTSYLKGSRFFICDRPCNGVPINYLAGSEYMDHRFVLGLYLGRASYSSMYGAAASIVVLIAWIYYSGQIFFLGAEFTRTFARRYGSKTKQAETA